MAIFSKTEDKKEPVAAEVAGFVPMKAGNLNGVLIQPRISEKAAKMAQAGKYVFKVASSANKIQVKKAVEQSFKVKVLQVNIVNNKGKNRTFGKTAGTTSKFKKAIVTLKE